MCMERATISAALRRMDSLGGGMCMCAAADTSVPRAPLGTVAASQPGLCGRLGLSGRRVESALAAPGCGRAEGGERLGWFVPELKDSRAQVLLGSGSGGKT